MGQQVSEPLPKDITNHIATYLSNKDLASIHSTSTSQSKEVSQSIEYVGAKCATETVDGLTCYTERMPASCVHWCKRNNAIRKFYAVCKMLSVQSIFKFDNQSRFYVGSPVYGSELISLRLLDGSIHDMRRFNKERNFSETDSSYAYQTHSLRKNGSTSYQWHVHTPEVIRSKFELLVSKPFSEWGGWELIIKVATYKVIKNESVSGSIYFKGKSIPCKGEVTNAHIYISGFAEPTIDHLYT